MDDGLNDAAPQPIVRLPADRPRLKIITCSEQEQEEHRLFAMAFAVANDFSQMGVVVAPGSTIEALIPQARSSDRRALLMASKACFEAE